VWAVPQDLEIDAFAVAEVDVLAVVGQERPGHPDAHGSGKLRVRVPGTFLAHDGKHVYFRDGERINLEVLWYGPHHAFDVADANPEPILLRTHGHRHG